MSAATTDALALVGLLAITGAVAIVLREKLRPDLASHWAESAFGDVPAVPDDLSHIGTHTEMGA